MALKDITTIEETEQLSADATFYVEDDGAFRRAGGAAVKDALGLTLESTATKEAFLNCFRHVAWVDENGQEYYDALYDALYTIPVSITATFVQGSNIIYNTDPLSTLRQYLVVRATYEDETVQTVTAYTLSGTLTVGTSTITAAYKGKSATFEVEVTQATSYITAVYTQGAMPITIYDDINGFKANLVVTYYEYPGDTGVVLSDSDYTLSGTLTVGTSTVLVEYNGNTTTFAVTVTAVNALPGEYIGLGATSAVTISRGASTTGLSYWTNETNGRIVYAASTGDHSPIPRGNSSQQELTLYPVPIPASASRIILYPGDIEARITIVKWSDTASRGWISIMSDDNWVYGAQSITLSDYDDEYGRPYYVYISYGNNAYSADKTEWSIGWV